MKPTIEPGPLAQVSAVATRDGWKLDGQAVGPIRGEDAKRHGWDELHDAYARELDAET